MNIKHYEILGCHVFVALMRSNGPNKPLNVIEDILLLDTTETLEEDITQKLIKNETKHINEKLSDKYTA